MADEKNLENMPQGAPEENEAKEVNTEVKEVKAMSSEALKVSVYNNKKDDFDDEEFMKPSTYWERKKRERLANKPAKVKKPKRKLTPVGKVILSILGVVLVGVIIYFVYYYIHYVRYDRYKDFLSTYEYEQASVYSPISESQSSVPGFELVAESENLKLYTDKATANVAVYDKRNGEIVYTNPVNADEDSVANPTNVNILKSQFVLYYYNDDVISGTYNSYADSVALGAYKIEGINNGIRYVYEVGNAVTGVITIPLEYRLYDDYFEVSVPASGIEEKGSAYLYRLQLLRNLGATSYEDTGYIVVPNGSGSIINFNNGKTTASTYSQYIYDIDPLAANYTTVETVESVRLPIFGICKEDRSILVSVEDGASECVITAGVSGVYNDYNYAYPTFVYRIADNLRMFGNSNTDVYVLEPNFYDINTTVRYTMLTEEDAGYSGLANYYRERLVNEGVLTAIAEEGDIPFYYDIIGGVKETGHFLGIQYLHTFSMTTFEEAENISNTFKDMGITNQVVNYQGWFNGGYYHDATDSLTVMLKLGGRSGLENLNQVIKANGGTLYGDVAFQQVTFADNYFPYERESSRYYGSGYVVAFGLVNPTTLRNTTGLGYRENRYDVLSPKFLPRYVEYFAGKVSNIDLDGISLRDLGTYLASDKKRTCMINREEALDIVTAQYSLLADTGKNIMTTGANAYSFAYTKDILNAPLEHTEYAIIDEQIPLYEMIIHGYINYSGDQLNFVNKDDIPRETLLMIETGASPRYVFTWDDSSEMKMTALNRFYSTTFDVWKDSAYQVYTDVNEALKPVKNSAIIEHQILSTNVRKVTYDNGVVIYVNYGSKDEQVDGVTVPAMGYLVEGM